MTGAVRGDSFILSMTALVATQTIWSPFTSRVAEKVYRLIVSVVVSGCGVRSEVRVEKSGVTGQALEIKRERWEVRGRKSDMRGQRDQWSDFRGQGS